MCRGEPTDRIRANYGPRRPIHIDRLGFCVPLSGTVQLLAYATLQNMLPDVLSHTSPENLVARLRNGLEDTEVSTTIVRRN